MSTIVDAIAPPRDRAGARLAFAAIAAVAGSLLIAGLAQVAIPLPFTPVPITGQTLGVLLVGAALGPALGGASVVLYLAEGAAGLPFFAQGGHGARLLAPGSATGGYLWGFVLAASAVGWLSRRGWDRSLGTSILAMLVGEAIIYATGIPWLMAALGVGLERALQLGLVPFVVGDVLKLLVAAGLLPAAWRLTAAARGDGP